MVCGVGGVLERTAGGLLPHHEEDKPRDGGVSRVLLCSCCCHPNGLETIYVSFQICGEREYG